jgi:hypothetical protein
MRQTTADDITDALRVKAAQDQQEGQIDRHHWVSRPPGRNVHQQRKVRMHRGDDNLTTNKAAQSRHGSSFVAAYMKVWLPQAQSHH